MTFTWKEEQAIIAEAGKVTLVETDILRDYEAVRYVIVTENFGRIGEVHRCGKTWFSDEPVIKHRKTRRTLVNAILSQWAFGVHLDRMV